VYIEYKIVIVFLITWIAASCTYIYFKNNDNSLLNNKSIDLIDSPLKPKDNHKTPKSIHDSLSEKMITYRE